MDRQLTHFKGGGFTTDSSSMASSEGINEDAFEAQRNDCKRKSRNLNEKKRRDQFNDLINSLHSLIEDEDNISSSSVSTHKKVDKSSVLKCAIAFLQKYRKISKSEENVEEKRSDFLKPSFLTKDEFIQLTLEAMDAFVLMVEANEVANIMYASQSILPLLGLCLSKFSKSINEQRAGVITNGISIYDIIHESQVNYLKSILNEMKNEQISLTLYLKQNHINDCSKKCTYELSGLLGTLTVANDPLTLSTQKCFVFVAKFFTPKFLKEIHIFNEQQTQQSLKSNEFVSRHSLEWKFLYLDHRASKWIGYLPFELLGTSGYDYYHWDDLSTIIETHERLMQKGEEMCDYRFLIKGQQWLWLRTKFAITYNQWNSKPEFIQCTHSVICFDSKHELRQEQQQQKLTRRPHSDSVVLPKRFNSRFKPYRRALSTAAATAGLNEEWRTKTCCTQNVCYTQEQQNVYSYLQNERKVLKEKIVVKRRELNEAIEQLNAIESQMICSDLNQSMSTATHQQQQTFQFLDEIETQQHNSTFNHFQ